MAADTRDSDADENVKSGRWNRLKSKLLPSRRPSSPEGDDLSDFLGPPKRSSSEGRRPLGPKLDTAYGSRWPGMSDVRALKRNNASDDLPPFRFRKLTRRPGLKVDFAQVRPEIIGDGGDESDEPTIAIQGRRPIPAQAQTQTMPKDTDLRLTKQDSVIGSARTSSEAPFEQTKQPPMHPHAGRVTSQMRAEEGRAFLTANDPNMTLRPGSSGSDSTGSRPISKDQHIPRKTVGSQLASAQSQQNSSPDSRTSTSDSIDPGIAQAPRYPTSLKSTLPHRSRDELFSGLDQTQPIPRRPSPRRLPSGPRPNPSSRALSTGSPGPGQNPPPLHALHTDSVRSTANEIPHSDRTQTSVTSDEKNCIFKANLKSFSISTSQQTTNHTLPRLPHWYRLQVSNTSVTENELSSAQKRIPILLFDDVSSFADSSLQGQYLRLDASDECVLEVACEPSHLRKLRVQSGHVDDELAKVLAEASDVLRAVQVTMRFEFGDVEELLAFKKAMTGQD